MFNRAHQKLTFYLFQFVGNKLHFDFFKEKYIELFLICRLCKENSLKIPKG